MARHTPRGIEHKCRRCKRLLLLRLPAEAALASEADQGWEDVELLAGVAADYCQPFKPRLESWSKPRGPR